MSLYGGTKLVFVISPPTDGDDRKQYDNWLDVHDQKSGEELQYPFLLSSEQFSGSHDTWVDELTAMNVELYTDSIPLTDDPEEVVYILGRPELVQNDHRMLVRYVKWLKDRKHIGLFEAKQMASGREPICLGTITVRNTRDRLPLIQEIEQFGQVRLAFIDIRNPWVD